ncbi:MAG: response regulator [Magnetococcus sp. MYC-9]
MSRILVVDDDESIRVLLREFLERDGHQVEEAVNGKQALLRYRQDPADLVITDIFMPEQDGFELILEIQASFPAVKIIAMSGGGCGMDASLGLRLTRFFGAVRQLEKPFTRERLLEMVHLVLHGQAK